MTNETVLLTLGRLPKGLELARALAGAGRRVIIAEPFGLHLSRLSKAVAKSYRTPAPNDSLEDYLDSMASIIDREKVGAVFPVSEEVIYAAQLRTRIADNVRLFMPDQKTLETLHDKFAFNRLADDIGLSAPASALANTPEADEIIAGGDYIVKPVLGCSGAGLSFHARGEAPPDHLRIAANLVQRRLYGREVSTFSVARKGRHVGGAVYRGRIFSGTVSCAFERVDDAPAVAAWIDTFVSATGHDGFIAFDFIIDEEGKPWPLECNPRLTSGIHFVHPDDLAAAALADAPPAGMRLKDQQQFQEGHTSLLEAYGAVMRPREFLRRMQIVLSSRDVLWSARDPLPFLTMTPMSWPVLSQVLFKGRSFGEAATLDIEWRPQIGAQRIDSDGSGRFTGDDAATLRMDFHGEAAR